MKPVLLKKKVKGSRSDRTKKVGVVLCDFCGSKRHEHKQGHDDDDDSLSMESELKILRLLNRRMTGKDLEGLSFAEFKKLKTHLEESTLVVEEEMSKRQVIVEEDMSKRPHLLKNKREGGDVEAMMTSSREKQDDAQSRLQVAYERQRAESPQSELERLWLWKERMSCRGLGDMTFSELCLLQTQMWQGLIRMMSFSPL
ncbi:hypothetical protein ISN44_As09g019580 [Arabidopsis suecica]|uniref:Agamous-like MADS-box protein AGL18 n=1 Tax=Arabidopsis suecica TaxID=45249 RepID=A0A8T2AJE8_ARASU|nr:hypothetical protein ISN44_As09g019580 [Arabidopsis suecica]